MKQHNVLPEDHERALLIGRLWQRDEAGPTPVLCRAGKLYNLASLAPTVSGLLERGDLLEKLRPAESLPELGRLDEALAYSVYNKRDSARKFLLAPIDLQAIKACGVTFAASMLERVIEERAGGDLQRAASLRAEISTIIGDDLASIRPGSAAALRLKELLIQKGVWSQYLEVGIGPWAEIFTKSQPMSSVGWGAEVGLHGDSQWNNPEPEIVLAVNSRGEITGATLGNDVNLRDIEGRSALLLGKAKDNNASCALGPFIRLFDEHFSLDDIATADVSLTLEGEDGFRMQGFSSMSQISRSAEELVAQTWGDFHQYPDGFVLFLGTMFAPVEDRDEAGKGFSHKVGDRVTISSPRLGSLCNWVNRAQDIPPWTFGTRELMHNLATRGLL